MTVPLVPSGQLQRDPTGLGLLMVQVPDSVAHFLLYAAATIIAGALPPVTPTVPVAIAALAGVEGCSTQPAFTYPTKNTKASPAINLDSVSIGSPVTFLYFNTSTNVNCRNNEFTIQGVHG